MSTTRAPRGRPAMDPIKLSRMRRQRLVIRQIGILGGLLVLVVVIGIASWRMWKGEIDPFLSAPVSSPSVSLESVGPTPCPVGAVPAYPRVGGFTVNALNGSSIRQAAATARQILEDRGFVVDKVEDTKRKYSGAILLKAGISGVNNAYLVLANAPDDAEIALDGREDDSVDLIIGAQWDGMRMADEVLASTGNPIARPEGCTPVEAIQITVKEATSPPASPSP